MIFTYQEQRFKLNFIEKGKDFLVKHKLTMEQMQVIMDSDNQLDVDQPQTSDIEKQEETEGTTAQDFDTLFKDGE